MDRIYRQDHRQVDLVHFQVAVGETDLDIGVRKERFSPELVAWVEDIIRDCRRPLEEYILRDPEFVKALTPYTVLPNAPLIIQTMADAVATACGNHVQTTDDLERALELASEITGIKGVLIIKDDRLAVWGSVKLIPMSTTV